MRSVLVMFGSMVVLAACSVGTPTAMSTQTATQATSLAPTIPAPRPTPTPVPVAGCPTDTTLSLRQYVDADPACFEGDDVSIRAWLDTPPPFGVEGPIIEPAWLVYPPDPPLVIFQSPPTGPDHTCEQDRELDCTYVLVHIDPASNIVLRGPGWVVVTGHVQDAAATTCHYRPSDDPDEVPQPEGLAVSICSRQFVLTSIADAP